jgi:rhodanese-related sulfurtransferase
MKPCFTCSNKPINKAIFKGQMEDFFLKQLPKTNKCFRQKDGNKLELFNLQPNKTIFYFATKERDISKPIHSHVEAYGNLSNSGIVKVNKDGNATVYLKCPQLYLNTDSRVYSRHMHFLYWDDEKRNWSKTLYTKQILCNVDKSFLAKKAILVDARPVMDYTKSHIAGAINLPYNRRWTEDSVIEEFEKSFRNYDGNKLVPIVLYCSKGCDMGYKLYQKLNGLGFYNTFHFGGNMI